MAMHKTLGEIAKFVGGELCGDPQLLITGFSGIKEAAQGDLAFLAGSKYYALARTTRASAVIVPRDFSDDRISFIRTDNPSFAFSKIVEDEVRRSLPRQRGIHPSACVAEDACLGKDVSVGPLAVIGSKTVVGDNSVVSGASYIGSNAVLGKDCLVYPNVTVLDRIVIGSRVIIHSGAVIGADGFGFVAVDGRQEKIPQTGIVEIGDDVEIGANVTIDRARFDKTEIGDGTKIDNSVQIAHNVRIGKNCLIVAQVGISGSAVIEDNCVLAGQVGVAGHLTVGKGSVVASKSGISHSVPPGSFLWGNPAKPHMQAKRVNAVVQRLPQTLKMINDLKKRVEDLERNLGERT